MLISILSVNFYTGATNGYISQTVENNPTVSIEFIIAPTYDYIGDFSDGYAVAKKNENGREAWGLIGESGSETFPLAYDEIELQEGGYAAVCKNGKWGLITTDGKETVPLLYERVGIHWEENVAITSSGNWPDQTQGLIDLETGRFVIPMGVYCNIGNISDGRAVVCKMGDNYDAQCGLADIKTGQEITPLAYSVIGQFSEGLALAGDDQYNSRRCDRRFLVLRMGTVHGQLGPGRL